MNARVYLLLDVVKKDCTPVFNSLSTSPGITAIDWLEGNPDVIIPMEAEDRTTLAKLMMPVLNSIENVTEDLRLLVSRAG